MRPIERDELEPLATGAWILGTGGGGSPYLSYLNLRKLYLLARLVSVLNLNLYLAIMNYMEGLKAGEYLFFFPYFLIMTFIISFTRIRRTMIRMNLILIMIIIWFNIIFNIPCTIFLLLITRTHTHNSTVHYENTYR